MDRRPVARTEAGQPVLDHFAGVLKRASLRATRSALYCWLDGHHDAIVATGGIHDWTPLCELAGEEGVLDGRRQAPTARSMARTWFRVKARRAMAADATVRPTPDPTPHRGMGREASREGAERPARDVSVQPPARTQHPAETTQRFSRAADSPAARPTYARADDPPSRSKEEVDAVIRFSGEMARVRFTKSSGYHREAREQQAALVAEAKALGLEHELPPLVFKDGD